MYIWSTWSYGESRLFTYVAPTTKEESVVWVYGESTLYLKYGAAKSKVNGNLTFASLKKGLVQ